MKNKSKLISFLLSVFVFPGAGQIYLKRKKTGYAIVSVACLMVIYPVALFIKEVNRTAAAMTPGDDMALINSINAMIDVLHDLKPTLAVCSIILGIAWIIGILDIIIKKDSSS